MAFKTHVELNNRKQNGGWCVNFFHSSYSVLVYNYSKISTQWGAYLHQDGQKWLTLKSSLILHTLPGIARPRRRRPFWIFWRLFLAGRYRNGKDAVNVSTLHVYYYNCRYSEMMLLCWPILIKEVIIVIRHVMLWWCS